jgi:hypothetical protein
MSRSFEGAGTADDASDALTDFASLELSDATEVVSSLWLTASSSSCSAAALLGALRLLRLRLVYGLRGLRLGFEVESGEEGEAGATSSASTSAADPSAAALTGGAAADEAAGVAVKKNSCECSREWRFCRAAAASALRCCERCASSSPSLPSASASSNSSSLSLSSRRCGLLGDVAGAVRGRSEKRTAEAADVDVPSLALDPTVAAPTVTAEGAEDASESRANTSPSN